MEKKIFFELKDNGEMNVTCHTLSVCMDILETHVADVGMDAVYYQYTITPVLLTDDEYEALGESDSY